MKLGELSKKTKLAEITGSQGDLYTISTDKDGAYWCNCPARKAICKHVKEYSFKVEIERALTQLEYSGYLTTQSDGAFEKVVDWVCKIRKESL